MENGTTLACSEERETELIADLLADIHLRGIGIADGLENAVERLLGGVAYDGGPDTGERPFPHGWASITRSRLSDLSSTLDRIDRLLHALNKF